ncbi:MAG: HAD-IIB family hydrolase [Puniceicoccaceae bacterium]
MKPADKKYLLVSDLDDTLLGDAAALRRFRGYYESECADSVRLAYASGRFADSIGGDIAAGDLPPPSYIIGGVGSEIRSYPDLRIAREWQEAMSLKWASETVRRALEPVEGMQLQPESAQSPFKVSYRYPGATAEQIDRLHLRLAEAGIEATIIHSSGEDLDVLPYGVDKGSAAEFVAHQMGYSNHRVITAGNSENDAALLGRGFHGIVVANAHERLRELAGEHGAYLSPGERAAGVEDGLRHWLKRLNRQDD